VDAVVMVMRTPAVSNHTPIHCRRDRVAVPAQEAMQAVHKVVDEYITT
jgi:hypothetical protein